MTNKFYYNTKIGDITIVEGNNQITHIQFGKITKEGNEQIKESKIIKEAYKQLTEYFEGKRKKFDLPLKIEGTPFRVKVWKALLNIPYGETRSYKQIAIEIGNSKASRAVGMANNKNPIPIIIPCHRVIGSNGELIGYASGTNIKKILLDIEKASYNNKSI